MFSASSEGYGEDLSFVPRSKVRNENRERESAGMNLMYVGEMFFTNVIGSISSPSVVLYPRPLVELVAEHERLRQPEHGHGEGDLGRGGRGG